MNDLPNDFRAGYVAIIGLPNAGKSTLMNALLQVKLSIISAKPQTTRRRVLGIMNSEKVQVIFLDTPGILKPRYNLQKKMMHQVDSALQDADALLVIVDAKEKTHPVDIDFKKINPSGKPALLLLNKIDLITKQDLLPLIELYSDKYPFQSIIPVSALAEDGLDQLKEEMIKMLPYSPPYYPPDTITDHPERFFAAEIIREKIFQKFYQEVPYSAEVIIEEFKERQRGKDYIYAVVLVERKSQKGILIGKQGEALKKIGAEARKDIEALTGKSVYLDIKVKVSEDWRRDEGKLKRMGY